jgi:hypothetical protein
VRLESGGTAVVFRWRGDRWRHTVTFAGESLAESVEGTADGGDARWPVSPPLVELSAIDLQGGPALLAVGLAGRSHVSASVRPHPERADTLLFEIACRVKERPSWLGSTYATGSVTESVAPPDAATGFPATVQWAYSIGPEGIQAAAPAQRSPSP